MTVPWPAGARRWRYGRRLRVSIIYSSLVSGCCAACPTAEPVKGPPPPGRISLQTTPTPPTWTVGRGPTLPPSHPPFPTGPQFLHLG